MSEIDRPLQCLRGKVRTPNFSASKPKIRPRLVDQPENLVELQDAILALQFNFVGIIPEKIVPNPHVTDAIPQTIHRFRSTTTNSVQLDPG